MLARETRRFLTGVVRRRTRFRSMNARSVLGKRVCSTISQILTQVILIDILGYMESARAIEVFAALAQSTRLETFRLLMEHEPEGIPAGEIARRLAVPQNTMSSHLAILARAGLVESERHSRSIVYRAVMERVREIASFLVQDCCGGRPELCVPLIAEFALPEEKNVC
jgi:Predicted transcriptional regulator